MRVSDVAVLNETVAPVWAFKVLSVKLAAPVAVKETPVPLTVSVAPLSVNAALTVDDAVSAREPLVMFSGLLQVRLLMLTAVEITVGFPEEAGMTASSFTPGSVPPQFPVLIQDIPSPAPVQVRVKAETFVDNNTRKSPSAADRRGEALIFMVGILATNWFG